MIRMTDAAIVQARLGSEEAARMDADREILGLKSRSDAVREGLRLLHKQARHVALGREYDSFYGSAGAPATEVARIGDQVAVESLAAGG